MYAIRSYYALHRRGLARGLCHHALSPSGQDDDPVPCAGRLDVPPNQPGQLPVPGPFGSGQNDVYHVVTNNYGKSDCPDCEFKPEFKSDYIQPCITSYNFV